jgi:NAD(P)-dependent dehydrogenase (short-subunit alcohol dehydrogenase family)
MERKVAIVTGASSGIGLGITHALLERGYSVVGTSRDATRRGTLQPSPQLQLVDGDIGDAATAARVVETALARFDHVDLLVNNAGIFIVKPFTEFTSDDLAALVSTNLAGFVHVTQRAIDRMARRGSGHVVTITTSLVSQPIAGVNAALPILIKGGLEAATRALAVEYAARGVRANAVAPGVVDTPMHPREAHGFLRNLHPVPRLATVQEIADAVLFLEGAPFVSGEILRVDGGAHAGKWS